MIQATKEFYERHRRWMPIAFFIGGFIFDAMMLRRVDELLTIVQQAVYILISALFIRIELIETQREIIPPKWMTKLWHYREDALHFLMGTLLNAYTIFFFKSSSALASFTFILLLVALLVLNEFGKFGKAQTKIHVAILSLCLISYFVTLVPILMGFIGIIPFVIANFAAIAVFYLFTLWTRPIHSAEPLLLRSHLQQPFFGVIGIFALLYFLGAIPPVPLSVRFMGVYHDIKKEDGDYHLIYTRPDTYFWQHGDQTFLARPGDTIYCFARIFSPSRFKDELEVRWLFHDPQRGWQSSDKIHFPVVGGREEGFRGMTKKTNYQPGEWRVQIETRDGRELGRLNFTIEPDATTEPRLLKTIIE